jgi:hypothetical protein
VRTHWICVIGLPLLGCAHASSSNLIEAYEVIDRGCYVFPADTLTLAAGRERYGVTCSAVRDPSITSHYGLSRPTGAFGRVALVVYGTGRRAAGALMRSAEGSGTLRGNHLIVSDAPVAFVFDSVPPGRYSLYAAVGRDEMYVATIQVRPGELWELWFTAPASR